MSQIPPPVDSVLNYAAPTTRPYFSAAGRAKTTKVLLWVQIALMLALIATNIYDLSIIAELQAGKEYAAGDLQGYQIAAGAMALLYLGVFIATIVVYLMWQYRVHQNTLAIDRRGLDYSPGWGVGYWFIPIMNLFRPYQVVKMLFERTGTGVAGMDEVPSTIGWWWAAWLIGNFLGRISQKIGNSENLASLRASDVLSIVGTVVSIAAAFLLIKIVDDLTARQQTAVGASPDVYVAG